MSNTTPGENTEYEHPVDTRTVPEVRERVPEGEETVIVVKEEPPVTLDEPIEFAATTSEIDAAVDRATTGGSDPVVVDAMTAAGEFDVGGRPYVSAATVGSTTLPGPVAEFPHPWPQQQAVYVQAPTLPVDKENRGFGVFVGCVGTVVFTAVFAAIAFLLLRENGPTVQSADAFVQFLMRPVFWISVLAFFAGFTVLVMVVNRGGWWAYVIFGLVVGGFVYFSYVGGALLTVQAWTFTVDETVSFINQRWLDPLAIVAGIVAREVTVWVGAWVARRGRMLTQRNRDAREEYERQIAAGPQLVH